MVRKAKTSKNKPSTSKTKITEKSLQQSTAGGKPNSGALVEFSEEKASHIDRHIHLRVTTLDKTHEILFRIKPTTNLANLKRLCCKALGYKIDELRFIFDEHIINDDDTPNKLCMMNYDVIAIFKPLRKLHRIS